MRYFKLMYDYENDFNSVFCDAADIGGMNRYITSKGKEITCWDKIVFEFDATGGNSLTDYLANLYGWFVVSEKFQELTKNILKNQIQYLPIEIRERTTEEEIHSYCVANIIATVDALDLANAEYDIFKLDDEEIVSVTKYALKGSKIENNHIFRLENDTIPIFVSEDFKAVIEENSLTGFDFLEVNVT